MHVHSVIVAVGARRAVRLVKWRISAEAEEERHAHLLRAESLLVCRATLRFQLAVDCEHLPPVAVGLRRWLRLVKADGELQAEEQHQRLQIGALGRREHHGRASAGVRCVQIGSALP